MSGIDTGDELSSFLFECFLRLNFNQDESDYVQCIQDSTFLDFSLVDFIGGIASADGFGLNFACDSETENPSTRCCSAVSGARDCSPATQDRGVLECTNLIKNVVLEPYKCDVLSGYAQTYLFIGILFVVALCYLFVSSRNVASTTTRPRTGAIISRNDITWQEKMKLFAKYVLMSTFFTILDSVLTLRGLWARQLWALLVKNKIILWQRKRKIIFAQLFILVLVGVLVGVLLGLTGFSEEEVQFGELTLTLKKPDSTRTLIYQNLRPFGGLYFLIAFVMVIAGIIVTLVLEKESRMREALRMTGLGNVPLILSWCFTYFALFAPLSIGLGFLTFHGAIFTSTDISLIALFFHVFTLSLVAFCHVLSIFFSSTRPAAIGGVVATISIFFLSFDILGASKEVQARAALLPPVALALGVNRMLADSSLGTGFAFAFATYQNPNPNLSVDELIVQMAWSTILLLVVYWYLDQVIPQQYGTPKPLYFLLTKSYWITRDIGEQDSKISETLRNSTGGSESSSNTTASIEFNDEVDREPPSAEEIELAKKNRCIQIRNLRRVFKVSGLSEGRVAVNNLNLNLYEGEITALLGPNGAGKSTTFGMLTGLISPSSGDALVYNHSLRQDMSQIRRSMGICPQHDILYTQLTVKQNLELFATLRNMPRKEIRKAIEHLLKDLAIPEKLNYRVADLSGGQKRKVSVAASLLGDSKVVYLDEPTAGMDPYSRRCTWDVLRKNRKGRVMVLTTHFMDEADLLGDRIAIVAEGNLCCHGSSLYLKHRFGNGYRLTVGKEDGARGESRIREVVDSVIPTAVVDSVTESEIVFQLPLREVSRFPLLLAELEARVSEKNIGISAATLEEVFLNVAEQFSSDSRSNQIPVARAIDESGKGPRRNGSSCSMLGAMLMKRFYISKRDYRTMGFLILLPIIFLVVPLMIPKIPIMSLVFPGTNKDNPQSASANCPNVIQRIQVLEGGLTIDNLFGIECCDPELPAAAFKSCMEDDELPQCITRYFFDDECRFDTMSFCSFVPWLCDVDVCCDWKNRHSPYYPCQQDTPLVRNELNYNDVCPQRSYAEIQAYVNSFINSLAVLLACIFPPASIMAYAVMETEAHRNTKFQQMVAGVRGHIFWLGNYLWDQVVALVPLVVGAAVFPLYGGSYAPSSPEEGVTLLSLGLVGGFLLSVIPLAYAWSFSFSQHAKALVAMVVLNMVTGAALGIISYVLIVIDFEIDFLSRSSREVMDGYLRYGLLAFPGFALTDGLLRLQTTLVYQCLRRNACYFVDGEPVLATGTGAFLAVRVNLLYLLGAALLGWLALVWRENRGLRGLSACCRRRRVPRKFQNGSRTDRDVLQEKTRLRDQHARTRGRRGRARDPEAPAPDAVQIFGLTKRYRSGKLALSDLWLGVRAGECFGYLGVNGAGKTTTMRILTGQEESTRGKALLAGCDAQSQRRKARRHLGFCPQFDALFPSVTVEEHLRIYARLRGVRRPGAAVRRSIERMNLSRFAKVQARQLSGGNKRKLSAAIALIGSPPIVFLDEPSTGMDPTSMRFMWGVIREVVRDTRCAVVLTTHSLIECEALCSRVGILIDGSLRCLGSLQHIQSRFGHGYSVEVRTRIVESADVVRFIDAAALPSAVAAAAVEGVCAQLGNPNRYRRVAEHSAALEKPFPGLAAGEPVSAEAFARWWLQEDLCDEVYLRLKGRWGSFQLVEKHGPYMMFKIRYGAAKLSEMFEFIESGKLDMGITHYSISQTGLEQIFNTFAKEQEAVSKGSGRRAEQRTLQGSQQGSFRDQMTLGHQLQKGGGATSITAFQSLRQLLPSGNHQQAKYAEALVPQEAQQTSRRLLTSQVKSEKELLESEYDAIMEAGDAARDASDVSEWECEVCTYAGTPSTELTCSLCGNPRPNIEAYVK